MQAFASISFTSKRLEAAGQAVHVFDTVVGDEHHFAGLYATATGRFITPMDRARLSPKYSLASRG